MPLTDSTLYPVSGLHVSFWMRSYDQLASIVVGVMSNPADTNTFVPVDTCQVTGHYSHSGVGFASYTGPHGHIAFRPLPPNVWSQRPPCVPITAMHVETTASAARMNWRYDYHFGTPTGYIVSYRPADDSTATPTALTTTAPEMILTGLDTGSAYWLSIVPVCGDDSGAAYISSFSTQALPCVDWDTTDISGDTLTLGNPGTGTNAMFPYHATVPTSYVQHLFLASEIPVSGPTTLQGIGFDYAYNLTAGFANNCTVYLAHTTLDSMTNSFVGGQQMVYTGSLAFGVPGWNYVLFNQGLFEYDGVSNLCVTIEKKFDHVATTDYTFHHETTATQMTCWGGRPHPTTGAYTMSSVGVNMRSNTRLITSGDVYCGLLDTCFPPIVYIDTIADGNYHLKWIPGYQETGWSVDYRMVDSINWNHVDGITGTELPLTSLYLEPSSTYELRVTPNCGDTSYATSVFFNTPCGYMHIPFDYDFDRLPSGTSREPPVILCWHHLNNSLTQSGFPCVWSRAHSGNRGLIFSAGTIAQAPDYQVIVLPRVNVTANPISTLNMSFWARTEAVYYAPVFYVGVMTDPTDIATFQYIDTIEVDYSNTNWDLYPVNLEDYNGYGEYIAIRATTYPSVAASEMWMCTISPPAVPPFHGHEAAERASGNSSWATASTLRPTPSIPSAPSTAIPFTMSPCVPSVARVTPASRRHPISKPRAILSTPSHTLTISRTSHTTIPASPLTTMPFPPAGGVSTLPLPLTAISILISLAPQLAQFMATTSCIGILAATMITAGTSTPYCLLSTRISST